MYESLVDKISSCSSHIHSKEMVKKFAYTQPNFMDVISKMAFSKNDNYFKASWILESIVIDDASLFIPYTDIFCKTIGQISNDSAKRCFGKIGTIITSNKSFNLSSKQQELLIECALDWLISDSKVAAQCYALEIIDNLYSKHPYLIEMVHPIINKNYNNSSPAFKNKAGKFVKKYIKTKLDK